MDRNYVFTHVFFDLCCRLSRDQISPFERCFADLEQVRVRWFFSFFFFFTLYSAYKKGKGVRSSLNYLLKTNFFFFRTDKKETVLTVISGIVSPIIAFIQKLVLFYFLHDFFDMNPISCLFFTICVYIAFILFFEPKNKENHVVNDSSGKFSGTSFSSVANSSFQWIVWLFLIYELTADLILIKFSVEKYANLTSYARFHDNSYRTKKKKKLEKIIKQRLNLFFLISNLSEKYPSRYLSFFVVL